MNHLRELLDLWPADVRIFPEELSDFTRESLTEVQTKFAGFGEHAVCFWMGQANETVLPDSIPELCRFMPFDDCWFEEVAIDPFGGARVVCGYAVRQLNGCRTVFSFFRRQGQWFFGGGMMEETSPELPARYVPQVRSWNLIAGEGIIECFLTAMNCINVRRVKTVPDPKLQKARTKRGKKPLFSFWTLELQGRTEKGAPQGGTHAGPRLHLRRGHPRQFTPGSWTWVQPHMVGNKAAGMVHKDYAAGAGLLRGKP